MSTDPWKTIDNSEEVVICARCAGAIPPGQAHKSNEDEDLCELCHGFLAEFAENDAQHGREVERAEA